MSPKHLFVYGTLKPGFRAWRIIQDRVKNPVEDVLIGFKMYSINGMFPGLKYTGNPEDKVMGYTVLMNGENLLKDTDSYEGYPYLYNREQHLTNNQIPVWVYTFNQDVKEDWLVKTGTWN